MKFKLPLLISVFFASTMSLADTPCGNSNITEKTVYLFVDNAISIENFKNAEDCLNFAISKPELKLNIDFQTKLIRVLLWQKKYQEAQTKIETQPLVEILPAVEKLELKAQMFWYQGMYPDLTSLVEQFKNKNPNLIMTDETQSIYEKSKDILAPPLNSEMVFEYVTYDQSQNQSLVEKHVAVYHKLNTFRLGLDLRVQTNKTPAASLTDTSIGLNGNARIKNHIVELAVNKTFSPSFNYSYQYKVQYSYFISPFFIPGFSYQKSYYKATTVDLFVLLIESYYKKWTFTAKSFFDLNNNQSKSWMFKADLTGWIPRTTLSTWYGFGGAESSRPYLIGRANDRFNLVGAKASYKLVNWLQPFFYGEYRGETGFNYKLLGFGVTSKF